MYLSTPPVCLPFYLSWLVQHCIKSSLGPAKAAASKLATLYQLPYSGPSRDPAPVKLGTDSCFLLRFHWIYGIIRSWYFELSHSLVKARNVGKIDSSSVFVHSQWMFKKKRLGWLVWGEEEMSGVSVKTMGTFLQMDAFWRETHHIFATHPSPSSWRNMFNYTQDTSSHIFETHFTDSSNSNQLDLLPLPKSLASQTHRGFETIHIFFKEANGPLCLSHAPRWGVLIILFRQE